MERLIVPLLDKLIARLNRLRCEIRLLVEQSRWRLVRDTLDEIEALEGQIERLERSEERQ